MIRQTFRYDNISKILIRSRLEISPEVVNGASFPAVSDSRSLFPDALGVGLFALLELTAVGTPFLSFTEKKKASN